MARVIPIIKLYNTLIVSIQTELGDNLVTELKEDIAEAIRSNDVTGLVIELSGVDILDSFIARSLRDIAFLARLMGVETVLAGLDPGMACTLVEMGMALRDVQCSLNLESALERFGLVRPKRESEGDLDSLLSSEHGDDDLAQL